MICVLAALCLPSARLWVSHDFFLDTQGRAWVRGAEGTPAAKPVHTGLNVLGAGATYDGGLVVFTGLRLAKLTLSQAKGGPLVTWGHRLPSGPLGGEYAVFPYRSGDTVVQRLGWPEWWVYTKGTAWKFQSGGPDRSSGVVQGGTAFWVAAGRVWANDLTRFKGGAANDRAVFETSSAELVPTDADDRVCFVSEGSVVEWSAGGRVTLGAWPGPGSVAAHDSQGRAFFGRLEGGKLVVSRVG